MIWYQNIDFQSSDCYIYSWLNCWSLTRPLVIFEYDFLSRYTTRETIFGWSIQYNDWY